jgi:Mrp family chromosome partitioning ATPase
MTSVALVGTVGGAGTTRLTVECAAALARDGRSVGILDAAFATQGLAAHVEGRLDPDLAALLVDDRPLEEGLVELGLRVDGSVACCPVQAPFARLARAKAVEAAERFERLIAAADRRFDHVLVDTPPIAGNQAIAAATGVERVAMVTPGTTRGRDALPRMGDRLADLGVTPALSVATRTDEHRAADLTVPESDVTGPDGTPACTGDGSFAAAVAAAAGRLVDEELETEFSGGLLSL